MKMKGIRTGTVLLVMLLIVSMIPAPVAADETYYLYPEDFIAKGADRESGGNDGRACPSYSKIVMTEIEGNTRFTVFDVLYDADGDSDECHIWTYCTKDNTNTGVWIWFYEKEWDDPEYGDAISYWYVDFVSIPENEYVWKDLVQGHTDDLTIKDWSLQYEYKFIIQYSKDKGGYEEFLLFDDNEGSGWPGFFGITSMEGSDHEGFVSLDETEYGHILGAKVALRNCYSRGDHAYRAIGDRHDMEFGHLFFVGGEVSEFRFKDTGVPDDRYEVWLEAKVIEENTESTWRMFRNGDREDDETFTSTQWQWRYFGTHWIEDSTVIIFNTNENQDSSCVSQVKLFARG
jgi:hypothetical protein